MDQRLIDWAVAAHARGGGWPPLWLFTDQRRLPDPRALVAALPKGLCGVVLRHDQDPDRARLGEDLARLCRARRNLLLVAGDAGLAHHLRAGLHLRGGRALGAAWGLPLSSSAHDAREIHRATRAGAALLFISPLFPTLSHPDGKSLGLLRWHRLRRLHAGASCALGGIEGGNLRRLTGARIGMIAGISIFTL